MAPRLPLGVAMELDVAVEDEVAVPADADAEGDAEGEGEGGTDASELAADAMAADGPEDGTAAVPPTLAQEATAKVATAASPDLIKIGRALARPCDMGSFCQQG